MAKYRVMLSETIYGSIDVDAPDIGTAREVAMKMINENDVPSGIMNNTDGYKVNLIEVACYTCDGVGFLTIGEYDNFETKRCPDCNPKGQSDGDGPDD